MKNLPSVSSPSCMNSGWPKARTCQQRCGQQCMRVCLRGLTNLAAHGQEHRELAAACHLLDGLVRGNCKQAGNEMMPEPSMKHRMLAWDEGRAGVVVTIAELRGPIVTAGKDGSLAG